MTSTTDGGGGIFNGGIGESFVKSVTSSGLWSFYRRGTAGSSASSDSQCSCLSCPAYPDSQRPRRSSRINEGIKVTENYRFNEVLGEGTYSVVYLAESKRERDGWVAIKVIKKSTLFNAEEEDLSWLIEKEIQILSELDHPHIVHLNEVYDNDESVCLVMELAKGGEVFDRLVERGSFDEETTATVIVQLLCAVDHIHKNGIIHRDLKLENILYYDDSEDSKIMVADFGLSEWMWEKTDDVRICGTPGYMAPEVLVEKTLSPANDVWSIGVITYILLAGYPPFHPQPNSTDNIQGEESALIDQIVHGKYEFHDHTWTRISVEAKDFIRKLMCVDPDKRLTCDEALAHPWLSERQNNLRQMNQSLMLPNLILPTFSFISMAIIIAISYVYILMRFFHFSN